MPASLVGTGVFLLACMNNPVQAQTYPTRPVRLIMSDGGVDSVGGTVAQRFSEVRGHSVIYSPPFRGTSITRLLQQY